MSFIPECLPCTFCDKRDIEIVINKCREEDCHRLIEMYCNFEPKESFQGIPPSTHEKTADWVKSILRDNFNIIAICNDRIVGHASLLEVRREDLCEYLIFVHQDHQDKGIGTKLTEIAKLCAKEYGFRRIWLSVSLYNSRAIHVYTKTGFKFISPVEAEREMLLELNRV